MTADQRFFGLCALVYGALFLACVFAGGLVTGNRTAWVLALGAMVAAFLCFLWQLCGNRGYAMALVVVSWMCATVAYLYLVLAIH